jgi:DUF4097 and DUF4098 domain-containing protein YvlB
MKRVSPAALLLLSVCAPFALVTTGCSISTSNGSFHIGLGFGHDAQREESHELTIASGQKLSVDVPYGDFRVHTTSTGAPSLHVKITGHGSSKEDAQRAVDAAHLRIDSTSDGVSVRVDDSPVDQEIEGGTVRLLSRFDLDIQLPPGVHLALATESGSIDAVGPLASSDLRSSYGKVEVSGVEGDLRLRSASGSVAASSVRGGRLEAVTSYGSVHLSDCDVATAIGKSSSGSVKIEGVDAERIEVHSGYGSADIERVHGDLSVDLSSGSARIEDLSGTRHSLKSNYGSLRVTRAKGDLTLETSSGSIKVSEFEGRLQARSGYGSISATGVFFALAADTSSGTVDVRAETGSRVESAWKLHSNYGAVKLGVPEAIACDLAAQTGYGTIDIQLAIEVGAGELKPGKSVRGKIHGGGELVSLESSSGSVKFYPLH